MIDKQTAIRRELKEADAHVSGAINYKGIKRPPNMYIFPQSKRGGVGAKNAPRGDDRNAAIRVENELLARLAT